MPDPTNTEIVRVTGIAGDTLTLLRAQEGTTARAIIAGDEIYAGITKKIFDDISTDISAASLFRRAPLTLTLTQIRALGTSPQTIVPAPGAGIVARPLQAFLHGTRSGTTFSANATFRLRWVGSTAEHWGAITLGLNPNTAGEVFRTVNPEAINIDTFDPRNKALEISFSGDITGGAAGDIVRIGLEYVLESFA